MAFVRCAARLGEAAVDRVRRGFPFTLVTAEARPSTSTSADEDFALTAVFEVGVAFGGFIPLSRTSGAAMVITTNIVSKPARRGRTGVDFTDCLATCSASAGFVRAQAFQPSHHPTVRLDGRRPVSVQAFAPIDGVPTW